MIKFGSVCSGIEAASVAWNQLGWSASWLAEIEPFPAAVLKHHYPDTPNHGDMTKLPEMVLRGETEAPDVLVGGTPCQSFSVAGMRKGLSDDRGQLTIKFVELANAIDHIRLSNNKSESIIVWENVPGVLSSKDNAFGCFLGALAGESCELKPSGKRWSNAGYIIGPKRAIAWRILDAQYFGVAQRRRRVFVVASARAGFCPAKVLFEFDGVRRDIAPSREQGQKTTGDAGASTNQAGFRKLTFESYVQDETASTMMARDHKGYTDLVAIQSIATCMSSQLDAHVEVAPMLRARPGGLGYPVSVGAAALSFGMPGNWIGRKPDNGGNSTQFMHEVAPTQTATDKHGVIAFAQNTRDEVRYIGGDGQIAGALAASPGMKQTTYLAFNSRQDPVSGGVLGALDMGSPQAQKVAYPLNSMTMLGRPSDDLKPRMGLGIGKPTDPQNTLSATHHHAVATATAVRRLTPVECERLQGFPDGWTQIPWRGKPAEDCPDSHRYKSLGNSMAVPVMRWIGERIKMEITK